MAPLVVTRNGMVVRGQSGIARVHADPAAPNGVNLGEAVSIRATGSGVMRQVAVTLPDADYSGYSSLTFFFFADDVNGDPIRPAPSFVLLNPAAGGNILGFEDAVLGAAVGTDPHYEMCATDTSGRMGYSRGRQACDFGEAAALDVTVNPTLDTPTEGEVMTGADPVYTSAEGVSFSWVYQMAEDAIGTGADDIADTGGICPEIDDPLDALRRGALFTGPGTTGLEGPYWSEWELITPASVAVPVTLAVPAIVASNRVPMDGMTGSAPTTGVLTVGPASAVIVGYAPNNATSGTLYTGPITGGTITDNAAMSWPGGAGLANGASAAWQITGGEQFYMLAPVYNGIPTSGPTLRQEIATDSAGTGATAVELSGSMPPHYGTKFYRPTWRTSGYGIGTYEDHTPGWFQIGIPTLTALTADDWYIETAVEADGTRVIAVWVRDSLNPSVVRWTTSSQAQIDANPYPVGHEPCTSTATTALTGGILYRRWTTADAIYSGKNFVVFTIPADNTRRTMFGLVAEIGGARTPIGNRKTVDVTPIDSGASPYSHFINRSQEQERLGVAGGACLQFPRAFDTDGDYVFMSYDVTYPTESTNYGDDWFSDEHKGLFASQSTVGAIVDGDYVHFYGGALYMRQLGASYRNAEGIYRKLRSVGQWSQRAALPDIFGSNSDGMRRNLEWIAKVAGSGSGPATRTLYAIYAPSTTGSGFTTIQIKKTTNGGDTWANDQGTVTTATHGVPLGLHADATALYMNTKTGVSRRPVGSATWTRATGISGEVSHLEKHGSTVYAITSGGLYTAADATTLAFTLKKAFNAYWFSVCPTNTNRIAMCGTGADPIGTRDNGANWFTIASQPYPGQPGNFQHQIKGTRAIWMKFHDTDPNRLLAMRQQHMGKCTNFSAASPAFFWASNNLDYSEIRGISFHATDYQRCFFGMTDRLHVSSDHGALFVMDDNADGVKDTIRANTGLSSGSAITARAPILLSRGTRTGYVLSAGNGIGTKTPVVSSRTVTTTQTPTSGTGNTGNGAISVTASADLPCGEYYLQCTTAATNGGTFTGTGPLGISLGTWTVGSARTYTHPRGGTLAVTISDGSSDFTAGANPKIFTITVNPIGLQTVLNPAVKTVSYYGAVNPATPYRGISGRNVFELETDGSITLTRSIAYEVCGYMGTGGSILLGFGGDTSLMRSTNEGVSWSSWITGIPAMDGRGTPIAIASSHDDQRAYCGTGIGNVYKVQNGTRTLIFDFNAWCVLNGVTGSWPGNSAGSSVNKPPISGVAESYFDPNLVYCTTYLFGGPYMVFRTKNALAATPVWENITVDSTGRGIFHPIQAMFISHLTDELIITSSHGNTMYRPEASHRTTYGITNSMVDDLRAAPGGSYHSISKL